MHDEHTSHEILKSRRLKINFVEEKKKVNFFQDLLHFIPHFTAHFIPHNFFFLVPSLFLSLHSLLSRLDSFFCPCCSCCCPCCCLSINISSTTIQESSLFLLFFFENDNNSSKDFILSLFRSSIITILISILYHSFRSNISTYHHHWTTVCWENIYSHQVLRWSRRRRRF